MTSLLMIVSLLGVPASGSASDSWIVASPADALAKTLSAHPEIIINNTGAEVLWRQGEQVCYGVETPRGNFYFVVKESITGANGQYVYEGVFVRGSGVLAYKMQGRLTALDARHTRIDLSIACTLDARRLRSSEIDQRLRKGVTRVKVALGGPR